MGVQDFCCGHVNHKHIMTTKLNEVAQEKEA